MKFYVIVLEDGTQSTKEFESKILRNEWLYNWLLENHHHGESSGYSVEHIFEGNLTWTYGRTNESNNEDS